VNAAAPAALQSAAEGRHHDDLVLVLRARNGDGSCRGGPAPPLQQLRADEGLELLPGRRRREDLHQEGLIGLYKAVRDYRVDKDTSFRSFAELCITRQIITAIKGARRFKHAPLNGYVSFSHTAAGQEAESGDSTLGDALAGPAVNDPCSRVISSQELAALVGVLGAGLSKLESAGAHAVHGGRVLRDDRRGAGV
jgi:RNA polymerase sporulation-specific sigma factor